MSFNIEELAKTLPISKNIDILKTPITVHGKTINNRMVIQPMEGCDGTLDGSPDELTLRRYDRFAKSGAGLIWYEAVAVVHEGRANKRQLYIHDKNVDDFKRQVESIKKTCFDEHGFEPVVVMQATHSGRYSKPNGIPEPIIAYNNPLFEKENPIPKDRIITDDELKILEEKFGDATVLAQQAGFDGIDIKCCHRYLNNEFLSAYEREGEYGGSFENRTRLYRNSIKSARASLSLSLNTNAKNNMFVTSRMNIYDGFPYPYGFGVTKDNDIVPVLDESIKLVNILHNELKMELLDITIGNPYVNPHVNRPLEVPAVERMYNLTKQIQDKFPNLAIIGSGLTFLKEESVNLAAGAVEQGYCKLAGFGRMSFAYPEFVSDLFSKGELDPKKVCITCGKCTELMRGSSTAGCVIRDKVYTEIYKKMINS